jgi:hypothetical protein
LYLVEYLREIIQRYIMFTDKHLLIIILTALYVHNSDPNTALMLAFAVCTICYCGGREAQRLRKIADDDADHWKSVCHTQNSCLNQTSLQLMTLQKELKDLSTSLEQLRTELGNELQQLQREKERKWLETLSTRVGSQV